MRAVRDGPLRPNGSPCWRHREGYAQPSIKGVGLPRVVIMSVDQNLAEKHWSLTTLREKLIKIGAKVVHHARYVTFQMAEVAVPRQLFRAILDRIRRLRRLPVLARAG